MSTPDSTCAVPAAAPTAAELDASCRAPVTFIFFSAAMWLVLATLLGLAVVIQLVSPDFLAQHAWLSYGRLRPAAENAFLYGFALQAALGVALWMICRLGQVALNAPLAVFIGTKFWNLGVTFGVVGILLGDNSGHEGFELPRYAAPVVLLGYLVIAVNALLTLHRRRERALYISLWYLLAALLWLPWIFLTADWLLLRLPVRGVMQSVVGWWFVNNLHQLVLVPFGLASAYYIVPKFTERPVHSGDLALFGFWTLVLVGGWGGIPAGAPVPAWLISISVAASWLAVVPALAAVANLYLTWKGRFGMLKDNVALRFLFVGLIFYLAWTLRSAVFSFRGLSETVRFTPFDLAQTQLVLFGVFGMLMFGALYEIVPRVAGAAWACDKMPRLHFWCALAGTVLIQASLAAPAAIAAVSGNAPPAFAARMPAIAVVGAALIALGNLGFVMNFIGLAVRAVRQCECCCPFGDSSKTQTAGVAS